MDKQIFSIEAMELGPMENLVYLIHDRASTRAAIVDPAWEIDKIIALAESQGLNITDVLLTHSHHDHTNGLAAVLEKYDAEVHLLKAEADFWNCAAIKPTLHHGGDTLHLGQTSIEILHTPGHTPGSACYRMHEQVITGDTLFVYGCGRCDLRGGDPEQMYRTLRRMAETLPAETIIRPGHHYAERPTSTMAEQIDGNPFMHFTHAEDFVDYRMVVHDRIRHTPYGPERRRD